MFNLKKKWFFFLFTQGAFFSKNDDDESLYWAPSFYYKFFYNSKLSLSSSLLDVVNLSHSYYIVEFYCFCLSILPFRRLILALNSLTSFLYYYRSAFIVTSSVFY